MNETKLDLIDLPGVGESMRKRLISSEYNDIAAVALADAKKMSEEISGLGVTTATRLIIAARGLLSQEVNEVEESSSDLTFDGSEILESVGVKLNEDIPILTLDAALLDQQDYKESLKERIKELESELEESKKIPKSEEWWRTSNGTIIEQDEFYALQRRFKVDIPDLGNIQVFLTKATFNRIGVGHYALLAHSNREVVTENLGTIIKRRWHVLGWSLGAQKPHHIFTPKYYDPERHKTAQEVVDVISGVEYENAERRYWKEAKDLI